MEDSSETIQQLQQRQDDEKYAREAIFDIDHTILDQHSIPWIMNHIDRFVNQSRGNDRVEDVYLIPNAIKGHGADAWDKVGQGIGNLQALSKLHIRNPRNPIHYIDEVVPITDWETLAHILSHVRQSITIIVTPTHDEDEAPFYRGL